MAIALPSKFSFLFLMVQAVCSVYFERYLYNDIMAIPILIYILRGRNTYYHVFHEGRDKMSFITLYGGFQLEFVNISGVINHMTCYKCKCSHWWKIYSKNALQDLLSSLNAVISTNESILFITGHVIYNPAYTYKFQLKTTFIAFHIAMIKGNLQQKK